MDSANDRSTTPQKVGSKPKRYELFTSEQRRHSVSFCGKGGTVEWVNDFYEIKNRNERNSFRFGTDVHNDTLANPHEIKVFGSRQIYFTEKI